MPAAIAQCLELDCAPDLVAREQAQSWNRSATATSKRTSPVGSATVGKTVRSRSVISLWPWRAKSVSRQGSLLIDEGPLQSVRNQRVTPRNSHNVEIRGAWNEHLVPCADYLRRIHVKILFLDSSNKGCRVGRHRSTVTWHNAGWSSSAPTRDEGNSHGEPQSDVQIFVRQLQLQWKFQHDGFYVSTHTLRYAELQGQRPQRHAHDKRIVALRGVVGRVNHPRGLADRFEQRHVVFDPERQQRDRKDRMVVQRPRPGFRFSRQERDAGPHL